MGYDYGNYADGSYPVQDATPATSGAASAGSADNKQTADIQQLAASGFHTQYAGAGGYPTNYYAGGYAAPQSAHMQQTGASMQQPAYGQPYGGGWQGAPSQGGTR